MILNARQNLFDFRFPKGFFFPQIEEKYRAYVRALPLPIDNVSDFVNHTIQSFTMPSISVPSTEQFLSARKTIWRGHLPQHLLTNQRFSVTFKLTEGYINYFILYDQLRLFLEFDNEIEYLPTCRLRLLDYGGREFVAIKLQQITMSNLSTLELSYTSALPQQSSFTCEFTFNIFELLKENE